MRKRFDPRRLSRTSKILFSLVPLMMVFLFAETVARIVCWVRFDPYETHFSVMGNGRWVDHDLTIWSNRPRFLEHTLASQYNEYGMRVPVGQVAMPQKEAEGFWVFLLGGSAIAGMGSNQDGDWLKITGVGTHSIQNSIDGRLEQSLQEAMPDRQVRVFNAAIASGTVLQSRLRYRELRHLRPDWVIAMDGVNDPSSLRTGETTRDVLEAMWSNHRFKKWPFREFRFLMRNSALMFLVGEYVYAKSGVIRTPVTSGRDEETYQKWLRQSQTLRATPAPREDEIRARTQFLEHLSSLNQELQDDRVRHLLLIQPHLSLRNPALIEGSERAVYNYYASAGGGVHGLMGYLHGSPIESDAIVPMTSLHGWESEVFVDYCHFTEGANRRIAEELAKYLLNDGRYRPFSSKPTDS